MKLFIIKKMEKKKYYVSQFILLVSDLNDLFWWWIWLEIYFLLYVNNYLHYVILLCIY